MADTAQNNAMARPGRKQRHRQAVRDRLRAALHSLYHNATPDYSVLMDDEGWAWLMVQAQHEIEYIATGGAHGARNDVDYVGTLMHPANGGQYKSGRARQYYVRWKMRTLREDRASNAEWERIASMGSLYQWGRGGRTLAPEAVIRRHGGSAFSVNEDYQAEAPIGRTTELIRILESFDRYVRGWCAGVSELWAEERARREEEARAEDAEREEWAARDVVTAH